ncbi:NAD-dependent epimerase/dehydratase family protein [Rhizobium sullae]|uniref:NAD-dependent epimerase/dehydratase family protein n=1 Tax=Rhizobium sullae TaxID=50338 RepID=A0A4R3Q839_RHISU|nr:NAD-dependent epimerase/dehydratase family protein [Rhizobium sullae]
MTRALVTDRCGFVGRHLCDRLLAEGFDVVCVDLMKPGTGARPPVSSQRLHRQFTLNQQDCRAFFESSTEHFNYVFHLAALVGGRMTLENQTPLVAEDLAVDAALWRWAGECSPGTVVCSSSSAPYPVSLQTEATQTRLSEDVISFERPIGVPDLGYGWTKLTGKYLMKVYVERYGGRAVATSRSAVWRRPGPRLSLPGHLQQTSQEARRAGSPRLGVADTKAATSSTFPIASISSGKRWTHCHRARASTSRRVRQPLSLRLPSLSAASSAGHRRCEERQAVPRGYPSAAATSRFKRRSGSRRRLACRTACGVCWSIITGGAISITISTIYFKVAAMAITGFGEIGLPGTVGKLMSVVTMMIAGISLFVRLA